jgi:hypothetical protein
MLREPRPNPVDEGYPFNPEQAAWLANYYSQSFGGGGGGHYGTMGSGYYDVGTYTMDDLMGSLWYATPNNLAKTFTNVNGDWYNTSTSLIYAHYDLGSNMASWIGKLDPGSLGISIATLPDVTRDWLEYHGIMKNAYSSKGTLDWIHYDRYGNRSCTQYSAISGTGPTIKYPEGGHTINAGTWTAYELEFSNDDSYSGYDEWGFKVKLRDQFGRTHMLIHPGMHNGTLGCIGLSDNNQLFDFLNRICNYDLSVSHTLNIIVSYGN